VMRYYEHHNHRSRKLSVRNYRHGMITDNAAILVLN
jgi:hypothetical protein